MMDAVIQFEGTIYEDGYGLLAQKVMRDKKLHKNAKLIYAYMCSFAGMKKDGERTAFPSVSLQCDELGMSEDTYYKYRKQLIEYGYIKIKKQRKEGAKFDNNLYSIVAVPVEENPYPKKSGMEPYPKNPSTVKPCTENSGTNINSFNINSFKKEEEEELTLTDVIQFLNEQISKREITNKKTLTAIFEVAAKCRAIGTTDRDSLENYCIKVIEDKMRSFGQKQKTNTTKKRGVVRKEEKPDWFDQEQQSESPTPEQIEQNKKEIKEMLKQLRG